MMLDLLWDALRVPSTPVPVDEVVFVAYILPPVICNFIMGVLALIPGTRVARVAMLFIFAPLALRAVASVDMSLGKPELKLARGSFAISMFYLASRGLDWASTKEPLVRHLRPANSSPSIIADAVDLFTNMRGLGWNWSHGLYIPQDRRPKERLSFVRYAFLSAVVHACVAGVSCQALLLLATTEPDTKELTVFDKSLPLFWRYLRASAMTALTGITCYASLQTNYDLGTVVGVLFLRQDPAQWPPAFDAPWRATSLIDFWGRRWHQWARRMFLFLGGYPLSVFFGRTGIILGAFLASGVEHDVMLVGMDRRADLRGMFLPFMMMAPGILAERTFYRLTGRKVGGVVGWVWTMTWLLSWFSFMTDASLRWGGFGKA